jgi:hypothetical protein
MEVIPVKLSDLITPEDLFLAGTGRTKMMPPDCPDVVLIPYAVEHKKYIQVLGRLAEINQLGDMGTAMFVTIFTMIDSAIRHAAERKQKHRGNDGKEGQTKEGVEGEGEGQS